MKHNVSKKLEAKSDKYKFVGYPKQTTKYYFYHPVKQKIFFSKHVIFLEKEFVLEISSGEQLNLKKFKSYKLTSKWNLSLRL